VFKKIKDNFDIICKIAGGIVAIFVTYSTITSAIAVAQSQLSSHEMRIEEIKREVRDDRKNVREDLTEIRKDIKEILKEVKK